MTEPDSSPVPPNIARLERQWLKWLDHFAQSVDLERDALPHSIVADLPAHPIKAADAVGPMFEATVALAAAALGAEGLSIDEAPYLARFCGRTVSATFGSDRFAPRSIEDKNHIARARTFSPVAVYRAIAADYGPERVSVLKNETLARTIYAAFSMGHQPVLIRAGNAVLALKTWSEKTSYRPGIHYSWSFQSSLGHALEPLIEALTGPLGRPGYLPGAQAALQDVFSYATPGVESRSRLALTPDVTLVFYSKKIEVLIGRDVALQLNAYLGEWLQQKEEFAD